MTASEIINRARSLSDLPNATFIDHDDEVNSLWESWKDIYSKITDSSDDYFINSVILDTSTATALGTNEWSLTLPDDIYKIRFVNFKSNGRWTNMNKFNTNNRNVAPFAPQYRFRGNSLWIIANALPGEIRIDYYPAPVKPSLPELSLNYLTAMPVYNKTNITSTCYFSVKDTNLTKNIDYLVYIYNGDIFIESTTLRTTATLYTTAVNPSNIVYNLGYLYWVADDGTGNMNIYRATTNFAAALTPVAITTSNDIANFSIVGDKIYASAGGATVTMNLDGSSVTPYSALDTKDVVAIGANIYFINKADSEIYLNGASLNIIASTLMSDGAYLYYLDTASVLHRYLINDDILYLNVRYLGNVSNGFASVIRSNLDVEAVSILEDTDFVYPLNEANEILAYSCAIDFKRKQSGDITALAGRIAEIWDRFLDVLRRDEGLPERRMSEVPNNWW